ncbi:MAG: vanadium-dependent haloperoxidase [Cyanobium sp. 49614_E6]|nr:vanadium-dependent haloperoxidase [Cyanobium sp. 49614_E6]
MEATTGYASGNAGGSGSCSGNAGQNNGSGVSNGQGSNSSNTTYQAWVSLYASTDNRFDTADILLSRTQVSLQSNQTKNLEFEYSTAGLALAEGSYSLIARIDPLAGVVDSNTANNQTVELVNASGSDAILTWTSCALNAIKSAGSNGKPGIPPTTGTRLMALLSTTLLDTVAAFGNSVDPYRIDVAAGNGISMQAAIVGAAQQILSQLLPGETELITAQVNKSLSEIGGSVQKINDGLAFGTQLANQALALRANDGSSDNTPYSPPAGMPGYVWMPAESGPTAGAALGCNWGSVTPWVISSASAYQPDGLQARPDVNLDLYAQQLNEVRQYGGLASTATTTSLRTAEQTEIALFWAYDRPDTFRPYGQLIDIAMDVAAKQGISMNQNAKLLACLNTALADAVICAWKAKYEVVQPRPYDLITGAFSDLDGVASTVRDTEWHSLLASINGVDSPPFPDYISGHSAMGGAFAGVMTGFFGNNVNFSAASQELPGVTRYFDGFNDNGIQRNSFYEAGFEDAISRVYGGVHIREACTDSFDVGLRVGIAVANSFLA